MRFPYKAIIVTLFPAIACHSGCYTPGFKQIDQKNIRNQFHVPQYVPFIYCDSNPREAGWFGREGLRIEGVLQFEPEQFREYLKFIENRQIWKPVRFLNYSPSIAESHSEKAFSWDSLPLHSWALEYLRNWAYLKDIVAIRNGLYYCALMVPVKDRLTKNTHGQDYYLWKYRMVHCSEIGPEERPVITTFGALDLNERKLYVLIGFSG